MAIALRFAARSDVGLVRSENQDSGYAGPHLIAVADGMGGHAAGDMASSVAIGQLVELDGESHGADDVIAHLEGSVRRANDEIQTLVQSHPELQGMGTTVTALLRSGNKLALAHIGDSRAYLLRGETFDQITHDHSFVQSLVDEGRITEEEAESHPQRSLVTRVLTGQEGDEPDLTIREARAGDRYLLCSDGLSGFVARDTIEEVLGDRDTPAATAERLVKLALRAGAPDNVTVVIADVIDLDAAPVPEAGPQVVGAAAVQRAGTRAIPVTPAEKAAALSREASGEDDEPILLAEEGGSSRLGRSLRVSASILLALIVIGGGSYASYAWTQQQYFVGVDDAGDVAVYRGVSQDLGPISLSSVEERTGVAAADLPDLYRGQVEDTIAVGSRSAADVKVEDLRAEATLCLERKAAGQACGTLPDGSTPTTTTGTATATTTGTTTGTTSPSPSGSPTTTPRTPTTSTTPRTPTGSTTTPRIPTAPTPPPPAR